MFTGIVEATAAVRSFERPEGAAQGARLRIARPGREFATETGESVSVSGACLTVAGHAAGGDGGELLFDLSAETLARTWFGSLASQGRLGERLVNLERCLRLADRLGGHLVYGHVDGVGRIVSVEDVRDGGRVVCFEVPEGLERYLIDKGSVAVDGISLTVVEPRGRQFSAAVVPHTLASTSLQRARAGDLVHVEADQVGKWIEKLVRPGG